MASWGKRGTPRAPRKRARRRKCSCPCPTHDAPPSPFLGLHPALRLAAKMGFSLEGRPDSADDWHRAMEWADGPGVTIIDLAQAAAHAPKPTGPMDALSHCRSKWSGTPLLPERPA